MPGRPAPAPANSTGSVVASASPENVSPADASPADASPQIVDVLDTADRLRLSATRLARILRQKSSGGLTPSQLAALASVERHGPLTLGELAEVEQVAPPSTTKVVAKLEADDLVARTTDPTDGRICRVAVTRAGAALLAETRRRRRAWLAARLRDLDADQLARLAAALDVLDELTTGPEP